MDLWDLDYEVEIKPVNAPGDPDEFYWHLYYQGSKVNGGITDTVKEAKERASQYRTSYTRSIVMAAHFWDDETSAWVPKSELNYG